MVTRLQKQVCDGFLFKWLVAAGLAWLEQNRERVNHLNVFPVPDGDTGTNMCLTLQEAYDAIANVDEYHVGKISDRVARGALRGGRGNSGVILSQLLSGLADGLREHEEFNARVLAKSYWKGVESAYKAVLTPVEGTILTVARHSAEALSRYVENHDGLLEALDTMLEAARDSLRRTPELLPVLQKAGVVDSGGQGLVYILEGMSRALHGEPVYLSETPNWSPESATPFSEWAEVNLSSEDPEGYGFDVQFLMHGQNLNLDAVRAAIGAMGWSTLVVGDDHLIKVHVHVHDPGEPLSYAVKTGAIIDNIIVENMQAQYEEHAKTNAKSAAAPERQIDGVAVIAVVTGEGMRRLFYDELNAAYVISGGQTMNPSIDDFLSAIESLPNTEIVLLPNNKNIVLAAQQAAKLAEGKQIRVVPTTTIPQGIGAMLAYVNSAKNSSVDEITAAMQAAFPNVITGEVTTAIRDSHLNGLTIRQGQFIGLLNNNLVVVGEQLEATIIDLLQRAITATHELVTVYYGKNTEKAQAQQLINTLSAHFPEQEFEIVYGGQPLYPYIFSVE